MKTNIVGIAVWTFRDRNSAGIWRSSNKYRNYTNVSFASIRRLQYCQQFLEFYH